VYLRMLAASSGCGPCARRSQIECHRIPFRFSYLMQRNESARARELFRERLLRSPVASMHRSH